MWTYWNVNVFSAGLLAIVLVAALGVGLARAAIRLPRLIDPTLPHSVFQHHHRYRLTFATVGVALTMVCAWRFGPTLAAAAAIVYVLVLLTLAWIDAEAGLLPDVLTLGLLWLGLLVNLSDGFVSLPDAVLGAVFGYLALWSVSRVFLFFTGREGMGYGDFKLLAALGAWTGWWALPWILLMSSVPALLFAIWMQLSGRASAGDAMRYGPFLAAAGVGALLAV
jgi:leader peptidase (prepilin peptidase)/N-methyltransferase